MKKQIRAAALALCALMIFATVTGCGKQEKPATNQPALETVEYSNLTDEDSRKQLSEEQLQQFVSCMLQFGYQKEELPNVLSDYIKGV